MDLEAQLLVWEVLPLEDLVVFLELLDFLVPRHQGLLDAVVLVALVSYSSSQPLRTSN